MLAASSLWIEQSTHRVSEGSRFNRALAVVHVPRFEQPYNLTAMRVVGLDLINSVDGVATTERQEWITAPFGPLFKAAELPTG
jgi:hypothetical protein